MRILFVTATYSPSINGVAYQVQILKRAIEKLGHQVMVLAPSFPGYTDTEKLVVRYPSFPNPFAKSHPIGIPLLNQNEVEKFSPQIIHTHHPLIVGKLAILLANKYLAPLFFTAHTNYQQYLYHYFPYGLEFTSKLLSSDIMTLAKKCHFIICPSPETQNRIARLGIQNTSVIPNCIEDGVFKPTPKKKATAPTLVYAGRIEKEKNPLKLIEISRHLKTLSPNFKLYLAGTGSMLQQVSLLINKYHLQQNVLVLGETPRLLLPHLYQNANLFITASTSEVMPLSIIEALSCGLPVIALKNSNLESLVTHNKNGLILPASPKIIANQIMDLFQNSQKLSQLSKNAVVDSRRFIVDKVATKLISLYSSAL